METEEFECHSAACLNPMGTGLCGAKTPPPQIKGEALFKKHFNHVQKLEDYLLYKR